MQPLSGAPARQDPEAQLEQAFIVEFLARHGQTVASLQRIPKDQAEALLKDASQYASGKLAEVESRAHLVHDLHQPPD